MCVLFFSGIGDIAVRGGSCPSKFCLHPFVEKDESLCGEASLSVVVWLCVLQPHPSRQAPPEDRPDPRAVYYRILVKRLSTDFDSWEEKYIKTVWSALKCIKFYSFSEIKNIKFSDNLLYLGTARLTEDVPES